MTQLGEAWRSQETSVLLGKEPPESHTTVASKAKPTWLRASGEASGHGNTESEYMSTSTQSGRGSGFMEGADVAKPLGQTWQTWQQSQHFAHHGPSWGPEEPVVAQCSTSILVRHSAGAGSSTTVGSPPSPKLIERHGFLEVAESPEFAAKLRSSSVPPRLKKLDAPYEQLQYLSELEDRASRLSSTYVKPCCPKAHRMSWSDETSTGSASLDSFDGSSSRTIDEWTVSSRLNASADFDAGSSSSRAEQAPLKDTTSSPKSRKRGKKAKEPKSLTSKASEQPITTFMVGNLPYRATKRNFSEALVHMGCEGKYDFISVPNANDERPRATNLGYGFINFVSPSEAAAFESRFGSFQFPGLTSEKQCTLKPARMQRGRGTSKPELPCTSALST